MPLLKFEVQADYDKVIKLREEINKLEQSLTSLSPEAPASAISKIETKLAAAKSEFSALTSSAAIAGAEIEDSFKSKISSASKTVNSLTDSIINQKQNIHDLQKMLRDATARYKELMTASKGNPTGGSASEAQRLNELIKEYNAYLAEEKDKMFNLTQEQARARLSVKQLTDEYKSLQKESGGFDGGGRGV